MLLSSPEAVVFIEVVARGTGEQHLRASLDEFAPNAWLAL